MSKRIERMFSNISGIYDMANHVYSLGIDTVWRRDTAKEALSRITTGRIMAIDIGTGTGDLAIELSKQAAACGKRILINGLDLNRSMLQHADAKLHARGIRNVSVEIGNALNTRFADGSFDLAVSAFALRNLDDLDAFSIELRRILKKGGKFVLADMAKPDNRAWRTIFGTYFWIMTMTVGGALNREAYAWLYRSVMGFDKGALVRTLRRNGFRGVRIKNMVSGVGFMVVGTR